MQLSISDVRPAHVCQGFRRREFLRVGGLALAGLGLPNLLTAQLSAAANPLKNYVTGKSVVLLFLGGGPSHIELFDPKMTAPVEIRSITGEVPTAHAGITFGGTFPQLGELAKKFTVVRSFQSKNSGHPYEPMSTAGNPLKAAMSSLYARVAGSNDPRTGMPLNTLVLPEAVNPDGKIGRNFETGHLPGLSATGSLGANYAAFNPSTGGTLQQDMEIKLPAGRFADRRALLNSLDSLRRDADQNGRLAGLDSYQQQAFEVITGSVGKAFDISKEDPRTIQQYDTSHVFDPKEIQRWGDMARSTNQLGKQMLLARRLVEAGCGFVTVSDCGWDMHSNGNSPKYMQGMRWLGPQVDHAVAAFIRDCEQRGLRDKVLLIVTGEMGRTPRINKDGGREHYGELTPLLVYGGGLRMGQVIGQSDRGVARPATEPYDPTHLMATIMHTLFDIGKLRLDAGVPRDVAAIVSGGETIGPLF